MLGDLVAQAFATASEEVIKWRGKREVTFDHLYRAALTGKIVPEDPRNVSSCDLDLPGFCGERLAHFLGLPLEGDGALEAER